MATIRKRGQYQWEAQVRRRGYPAQSQTFNTKAEAEAWASMIESEMPRGVWLSRGEAEATTFYEALTRYEEEISSTKKGAGPESSVLKTLKDTDLARRPLASIRSADVARLRDEWLKVYRPATVLRRLAVASHVFSIARKEWGMESLSNPVELVCKPQPDNARTRRITTGLAPADLPGEESAASDRGAQDGELERIVSASGSALLPSIIWLAVETAMRGVKSWHCGGNMLILSAVSHIFLPPKTGAPAMYHCPHVLFPSLRHSKTRWSAPADLKVVTWPLPAKSLESAVTLLPGPLSGP